MVFLLVLEGLISVIVLFGCMVSEKFFSVVVLGCVG